MLAMLLHKTTPLSHEASKVLPEGNVGFGIGETRESLVSSPVNVFPCIHVQFVTSGVSLDPSSRCPHVYFGSNSTIGTRPWQMPCMHKS